MLGVAKQGSPWRWTACGKHPSAGDYFSIGRGFPLASGFAAWVTRGYGSPPGQTRSGVDPCSWRFWTRGENMGDLACGLLRDSSDSAGRPFPLLVMGTGRLPSWEEHWDLLPLACEGTWRQMEYVSAKIYGDLGKLENDLIQTRPPCPEWPNIPRPPQAPAWSESEVQSAESRDSGLIRISLNDIGMSAVNGNSGEIHELLISLNMRMRNTTGKVPAAFFLGGTLTRSFLVFFHRPLCTDDFRILWSPDDRD